MPDTYAPPTHNHPKRAPVAASSTSLSRRVTRSTSPRTNSTNGLSIPCEEDSLRRRTHTKKVRCKTRTSCSFDIESIDDIESIELSSELISNQTSTSQAARRLLFRSAQSDRQSLQGTLRRSPMTSRHLPTTLGDLPGLARIAQHLSNPYS